MPRSTPKQLREQAKAFRPSHRSRDPQSRAAEHQHFQVITRSLRLRRSARPPALSSLTAGTVVWAWVCWRESGGGKVRPAVVLSADGDAIVVLGLSSLRPGRMLVPLPQSEPFLSGPSGCKLHHTTLDRTDIVSVAGALAPLNRAAVDAVAITLSLQSRHDHCILDVRNAPPPPAVGPRPPAGFARPEVTR